MARDPARIDRILWLLTKHWRANPDLRLGQIIGNFTPRVRTSVGGAEPGDPYYVEDDVIEAALRRACKHPSSCTRCGGTGVIDTGNNDLPCDCPAGDTAVFNVCGEGQLTGAEMKRRLLGRRT